MLDGLQSKARAIVDRFWPFKGAVPNLSKSKESECQQFLLPAVQNSLRGDDLVPND